MQLTGAQIIMECLVEHEVDTVFGFPGGSVLPLYDELYKNSHRIRHFLTAHEQGAVHAADGYARATGKTGVCIATSGPGATNLVTGIATAYMDSIPMVVITGNVSTALIGTDSFQELDITGVTMPITKNNSIVKDIRRLADVVRDAFALACSGRPGPVLVDVPKDIMLTKTQWTPRLPVWLKRNYTAEEWKGCLDEYERLSSKEVDNAVRLLEKSSRPFILVGGGVVRSGASQELVTFAEKMQAPVCCTLMGLSGFPASHSQYLGNIGMHGNRASNISSTRCDCFIAIGSRFNDRVLSANTTFAGDVQILHIDIDRAEINKNVLSHHYMIGDAALVLGLLNRRITGRQDSPWLKETLALKAEMVKPEEPKGNELHPESMMKRLREVAGDDCIVATDVGQHQMWAAQHCPFEKPGTFITSGGLGTMGFGLGAAMGALIARPTERVVLVTGDGSFRMNCNELATVSHYNIPVVIVVVNNGSLGMVRQWQTLFYDKRYSQTNLGFAPDFVKLADAYGMKGYRIRTLDEFSQRLQEALEARQPAILDCIIDPDEMVRPMVAAGDVITKFTLV